MTAPKRVAIACQGGGSHTAFTAGVLKRLLRDDRYEIVALSGTSGGAVCAFLAWHGLSAGQPDRAVALLDEFWADNTATQPWDAVLNGWLVAMNRLEGAVLLPVVSPYLYPPWAQEQFRQELNRLVPPNGGQPEGGPLLLIGAVDVCSGEFKAFSSARNEITADAVLASAAIPTLFRAVHVGGAAYWDGLFSQNPPVRELPDAKPDAIWVVRINPSARGDEPTTVAAIADRRNELAGNLSLSQELKFIRKINELVENGDLAGTKYRKIAVEEIDLDRDLDTASKLDRSPGFIAELIALGEKKAEDFLARL